MIVTVAQLAKEFNRDERTVQLLARKGMPKAGHGQYDLEKCKTWYIAYLQQCIASRSSESGEAEDDGNYNVEREQARWTAAKASIAEIDLGIKRGEVVPIQVVEDAITGVVASARQQLLALPGRIAPQLEGETRAVIKARLATAVNQTLTSLSEVKIDVNKSNAADDAGSGNDANGRARQNPTDLGTAADPDSDGMGGTKPDNP